MNRRLNTCSIREHTFEVWLTFAVVSIALPATAFCQPIIEGEDIVNASEELRDALYERHELQQELKHLDREREALQAELKRLDKLVEQQKALDSARKNLEAAEEAGDDALIQRLEEQVRAGEAEIELYRSLHEFEEQASEARDMLNWLREEGDDRIAKRVLDRLDKDIAAFELLTQFVQERHGLRASEDVPAVKELDKRIDKLYEMAEAHGELMGLLFELMEESEDENDEAIDDLIDEINQLAVLAVGDEQDRSRVATKRVVHPSHLPVPVTESSLAEFASADFDSQVVPLLRRYCVECHGDESSSGELNIEQMVQQRPLVVNRSQWINVIEQAKNRVMPPEDGVQPTEKERATIVLATHQAIYNFEYSTVRDPGFESARRLTHAEYDNTIRDLFGVEIEMAQRFPSDLTGTSGFENSANTLFIQPLMMERYMGAADQIIATLLPDEIVTESHKTAHAKIFIQAPGSPEDEHHVAGNVLEHFVTRAYRRPLSSRETAALAKSYNDARSRGLGHELAIKGILRATLISPNFLLRSETDVRSDREYRVSDWDLASRLSYFLWASMPDAELLRLAEAGQLRDSKVLTQQVDRMIDDPRSETLGSLFAAQWLGSQHLGTRMRLDPIDNPWCTESLMAAMRAETSMFFHSLIKENAPIERLIDADYTFLNRELAKLYKITGVRSDEMQRVQLSSDRRGGILGQGSLLAVTSFPYRTSPVARGKWVLDTVLGTPPPPPPPNVSEFSEDIAEKRRLSIKQKLELHRSSPNCYACHSQMDPIGLSLENYDWFGRWRDRYGRTKIDSEGSLPNGTKFTGLAGLKNVIVEQRSDELVRQVTTKMLSYSLGRQLEYYDEPAIREIIMRVGKKENRFRSLVHGIVESYPFQYKKNRATLAKGE